MPVRKVVITGPESTGKTHLAHSLASCFNTLWVPEYAREYISGLKRNYNYNDVEHIASEQVRLEKHYLRKVQDILFYDTDLIVTKVWFKVVYGRCPGWIDEVILNNLADLFLVCNTDIPWVPDPLRENGGEMREVLMEMYITEINITGAPWKLVTGKGEQRINSAVDTVKTFFNYSL